MKLLPKTILVRKCTTGQRKKIDGHDCFVDGGIVLTDIRGNYSRWAEIVDVADECELFAKKHVGGFVFLKEWAPRHMKAVVPELEFVVKEDLFKESAPAAVWR
jgi:hypothetical protein